MAFGSGAAAAPLAFCDAFIAFIAFMATFAMVKNAKGVGFENLNQKGYGHACACFLSVCVCACVRVYMYSACVRMYLCV